MHKDFEVVADPFGEEAVTEPMTGLYWNPQNPRGYQAQWNRGVEPERIALTSYGAFGSNYPGNVAAAERWCDRARAYWEQEHADTKKDTEGEAMSKENIEQIEVEEQSATAASERARDCCPECDGPVGFSKVAVALEGTPDGL